ncbi:MAG: GH3 auxin-responsive promoter family protein [Lachnospiraceae bacterium]|nr:GH3 auxin-responsive promoter family protein [Lachnospiraceae bacterium]
MDITRIFPELKPEEKSFQQFNNDTLMKIIADNKDTDFGRLHGFSDISSPDEYRQKVAFSEYEDYRPFMDKIAKGEMGVLSSYEPYCLLETSGSTSAGKIIPITEEALSRYGNVMDRYLEINGDISEGKRFFLSFLGTNLSVPLRSTDKMLFTASYYRYLVEKGLLKPETLAGGEMLNFFTHSCNFLYAKLWLAFATKDLTSMEAVYLYDFLIFFHYMADSYKSILADMEAGVIPSNINLPVKVREALLSIKIEPDRLSEVRRECEAGFTDIVGRLWPKIKLISGIGSKAFMTEEISIKKHIGNLPVWHYIYAASECLMAVPLRPDSFDFVLYPNSAYYEFRPENAKSGETVEPSQLTVGECYEPVITTFSGLYRYGMGDILKVTGFLGDLPILRFQYRVNLMLNIAGEKLDIKTLDRAVRKWFEKDKVSVWQYYFSEYYDTLPACYHGIIALETGEPPDEEASSLALDLLLRNESLDYDDLRRLNSISMLKVSFVDKNAFIDLKSNLNKKGQPKPLHIIN